MLKKVIKLLIRKVLFLGIGSAILITIGYFLSDRKDYPGKSEFEEVDSLITTGSGGAAHGDSEDTKKAAAEFSSAMKSMQANLFSGGNGRSFATGGEFLTYIKRAPNAVVVLCHVPELRNYKDEETRESLSQIAWSVAKSAVAKINGIQPTDTLIVGLRGFGSYGPIWEGEFSGNPTKKTDEVDEQKRLYPFFLTDNSEQDRIRK